MFPMANVMSKVQVIISLRLDQQARKMMGEGSENDTVLKGGCARRIRANGSFK